ncbi:MAG: hypothetical protein DGJ47_001140, partial [Rickettsiaceae bacterium]
MLNFIKAITLSVIFCLSGCFAEKETSQDQIEKIRKSIVTINTRVPMSAYDHSGSWSGTGFIVDSDKGYIATNNHVVGRAAVGTYFVTFHNGQQAEAKLVFNDEYIDFAVLQINTKDLPLEYEVVEFTEQKPQLGAKMLVVGNTEGQGFSFHHGHLADLYEISGGMPQGSYNINLNIAGGASGSPVLNDDNKAVAVLYGGGKTHAIALKGDYVRHILSDLRKGSEVRRKHIGVITHLTSLDKAVKHRNFPKDKMDSYLKDFPDARNRVVTVHSVLNGSTAQGLIKAGDILWKINGKKVGADLCNFDLAMSQHDKNEVQITVIRKGKEITQTIKLYNLNDNAVNKMVEFAGGLFFKADDYMSHMSGVKLGDVMLANVQPGSSFSNIKEGWYQDGKTSYRIVMSSLNNHPINNLEDVVSAITEAVSQKYIN